MFPFIKIMTIALSFLMIILERKYKISETFYPSLPAPSLPAPRPITEAEWRLKLNCNLPKWIIMDPRPHPAVHLEATYHQQLPKGHIKYENTGLIEYEHQHTSLGFGANWVLCFWLLLLIFSIIIFGMSILRYKCRFVISHVTRARKTKLLNRRPHDSDLSDSEDERSRGCSRCYDGYSNTDLPLHWISRYTSLQTRYDRETRELKARKATLHAKVRSKSHRVRELARQIQARKNEGRRQQELVDLLSKRLNTLDADVSDMRDQFRLAMAVFDHVDPGSDGEEYEKLLERTRQRGSIPDAIKLRIKEHKIRVRLRGRRLVPLNFVCDPGFKRPARRRRNEV